MAGAAPDPVGCTGYPEPRILLENQSWWESQPGPPTHPGTGKQGHIHVAMCFPLYQTIGGNTLHLDITVKLHNMPGTPGRLTVRAYGDTGGPDGPIVPRCATADCEYSYGYDFPLSRLRYSGWREVQVYVPVNNADGTKQYNSTRFYVNFDVPKPAAPRGSTGTGLQNVGGDTWYSSMPAKYARANMLRADVPWDEATGALTPVSGTWTPRVTFEKKQNFVYIDPALHATPPSHGTVVYERTTTRSGYHAQRLAIDTTRLANGLHRLLIGSSNVAASGTNTGVLVIPFIVDNDPCTRRARVPRPSATRRTAALSTTVSRVSSPAARSCAYDR
jgi:hypothetical protein